MNNPASDRLPIREYEAAGGVVVRDGKVLLLWRPSRSEIRLPKGHVEPGESCRAAALRETREEGGVAHPRIVADLGRQQVEFDREGIHWVRQEAYYLMTLDDPAPYPRDPEDAAEFAPFWIPLNEAETLLTFPTEREFLRRASAALQEGLIPDSTTKTQRHEDTKRDGSENASSQAFDQDRHVEVDEEGQG